MPKRSGQRNHDARLEGDKARSSLARLGKDEMNIIEHPFASLGKNESVDAIIYHEWETEHPLTNQTVKAWWRVEGSPELGLPTPTDERVYLVLMELTREAGFTAQAVPFTRHDLILRLQWPVNQQSYKMLEEAFIRLKGVTITAKNAFWNPRVRSFSTVGFSIIDAYEIFNEKPGRKSKATLKNVELPLSYFKWSDVMFQSFQDGYIRSIDLHLALSLKRPLSLRLCRYLGKKAYGGRATFEISLRDLCEYHLGMAVDGRFDSKLKVGLRPAHEELIERGVLQGVSYAQMKSKKGEKVCYIFPPRNALPQAQEASAQELSPEPQAEAAAVPGSPSDPPAETASQAGGSPKITVALSAELDPAPDEKAELVQQVLALGISHDVALGLLGSFPLETLRSQLDCLSDRNPRDPAALFLYAVRRDLAPPPTFLARVARTRQREAEQAPSARSAEEIKEAQAAAARAWADKEALRRHLGTATAFYEGLCDEAKALVRFQVREELKQNGVDGRWQYPQPLWMEVLCSLLRDETWRRGVEEEHARVQESEQKREQQPEIEPHRDYHPEQEANWTQCARELKKEAVGDDDPALIQPSLFPRLEMYVDALRQMVVGGEVAAHRVDCIKESAFPLLDAQEWSQVKARALEIE